MKLSNGKVLEIIARNCSVDNKYIQSAKLNGKVWSKPWFRHEDIENGGKLEFVMGINVIRNGERVPMMYLPHLM